jgi:hypothetical protein
LWSNNWPLDILLFADNKVYVGHSEHSPLNPKPRGAPFICIDTETGAEVFRVDGVFRSTSWGGKAIIGDSIIATMNTYDQQIYAIGKGASKITASIQDNVVTLGTNAMVTGTVMDVSPGTNDAGLAIRFSNGVPAIADEYMGQWMKYVYMHFERPVNAVGVPVKLEAVDPNGNYQNLGTTTSDAYGNYALAFEPEVPGTYMIIATFEGSESYYGSTSTTYLNVDVVAPATPIEPEEPTKPETPTEPEEPETPEEPTEPEQPAEAPLISTEVAIVIAVAIAAVIGVAAFWALRKRR